MEDKRTEQYRQELKEFVMSHTEDVLKNPRSFIRYPFIDPGSVYDGNVWDWDTYWSVYGFLNLADSYESMHREISAISSTISWKMDIFP